VQMNEEMQHEEIAGPLASPVSDKVLENPDTHMPYLASLSHVTYILGGLAGFALAGVFALSWLVPTMPESVVLLGSTVATACVSGLVGYIAGQAVRQ
jgi:hypothetical protein